MATPASKPVLLAIVVFVGAGAVAGALLWSNRPQQEDIPPRVRESARRASHYFDSLPTVPVTAPTAVFDMLANAPPIPEQPFTVDPTSKRKEKLLRRIAEWLQLRHEGDPGAYAQWARSQDYVLTLTRDDVEQRPRFYSMSQDGRERFYQFHTGRPLPSDMSPLEYFRFCFQTSLELNDSLLRPAVIAAGAQGAHVLFKRVQQIQHLLPLNRWERAELWHGGWTAGSAVHWSPPVLLEELLSSEGSALCAIVTVAVKSVEGDWVPMIISAYWIPSQEDWYLFQVTYSNTPSYGGRFEI